MLHRRRRSRRDRQRDGTAIHRRPSSRPAWPAGSRAAPPAPVAIDLLVDVDLDRTDIAAAAVQCRSERQVAVFALVEGRVDDQTDRARIGGTVAEAAAAPVDRAGVYAGAAADAFERGPELRHAEALGPAVVDQHDVHLAACPRPAEMRSVLRDR